ncbi:hypothetical protein MPSEU_000310500 [Mayamaea pseudoterrestris]|nr:hypothetical protein MPSEU_000310500 [Mayamaea pseudoterrestris]
MKLPFHLLIALASASLVASFQPLCHTPFNQNVCSPTSRRSQLFFKGAPPDFANDYDDAKDEGKENGDDMIQSMAKFLAVRLGRSLVKNKSLASQQEKAIVEAPQSPTEPILAANETTEAELTIHNETIEEEQLIAEQQAEANAEMEISELQHEKEGDRNLAIVDEFTPDTLDVTVDDKLEQDSSATGASESVSALPDTIDPDTVPETVIDPMEPQRQSVPEVVSREFGKPLEVMEKQDTPLKERPKKQTKKTKNQRKKEAKKESVASSSGSASLTQMETKATTAADNATHTKTSFSTSSEAITAANTSKIDAARTEALGTNITTASSSASTSSVSDAAAHDASPNATAAIIAPNNTSAVISEPDAIIDPEEEILSALASNASADSSHSIDTSRRNTTSDDTAAIDDTEDPPKLLPPTIDTTALTESANEYEMDAPDEILADGADVKSNFIRESKSSNALNDTLEPADAENKILEANINVMVESIDALKPDSQDLNSASAPASGMTASLLAELAEADTLASAEPVMPAHANTTANTAKIEDARETSLKVSPNALLKEAADAVATNKNTTASNISLVAEAAAATVTTREVDTTLRNKYLQSTAASKGSNQIFADDALNTESTVESMSSDTGSAKKEDETGNAGQDAPAGSDASIAASLNASAIDSTSTSMSLSTQLPERSNTSYVSRATPGGAVWRSVSNEPASHISMTELPRTFSDSLLDADPQQLDGPTPANETEPTQNRTHHVNLTMSTTAGSVNASDISQTKCATHRSLDPHEPLASDCEPIDPTVQAKNKQNATIKSSFAPFGVKKKAMVSGLGVGYLGNIAEPTTKSHTALPLEPNANLPTNEIFTAADTMHKNDIIVPNAPLETIDNVTVVNATADFIGDKSGATKQSYTPFGVNSKIPYSGIGSGLLSGMSKGASMSRPAAAETSLSAVVTTPHAADSLAASAEVDARVPELNGPNRNTRSPSSPDASALGVSFVEPGYVEMSRATVKTAHPSNANKGSSSSLTQLTNGPYPRTSGPRSASGLPAASSSLVSSSLKSSTPLNVLNGNGRFIATFKHHPLATELVAAKLHLDEQKVKAERHQIAIGQLRHEIEFLSGKLDRTLRLASYLELNSVKTELAGQKSVSETQRREIETLRLQVAALVSKLGKALEVNELSSESRMTLEKSSSLLQSGKRKKSYKQLQSINSKPRIGPKRYWFSGSASRNETESVDNTGSNVVTMEQELKLPQAGPRQYWLTNATKVTGLPSPDTPKNEIFAEVAPQAKVDVEITSQVSNSTRPRQYWFPKRDVQGNVNVTLMSPSPVDNSKQAANHVVNDSIGQENSFVKNKIFGSVAEQAGMEVKAAHEVIAKALNEDSIDVDSEYNATEQEIWADSQPFINSPVSLVENSVELASERTRKVLSGSASDATSDATKANNKNAIVEHAPTNLVTACADCIPSEYQLLRTSMTDEASVMLNASLSTSADQPSENSRSMTKEFQSIFSTSTTNVYASTASESLAMESDRLENLTSYSNKLSPERASELDYFSLVSGYKVGAIRNARKFNQTSWLPDNSAAEHFKATTRTTRNDSRSGSTSQFVGDYFSSLSKFTSHYPTAKRTMGYSASSSLSQTAKVAATPEVELAEAVAAVTVNKLNQGNASCEMTRPNGADHATVFLNDGLHRHASAQPFHKTEGNRSMLTAEHMAGDTFRTKAVSLANKISVQRQDIDSSTAFNTTDFVDDQATSSIGSHTAIPPSSLENGFTVNAILNTSAMEPPSHSFVPSSTIKITLPVKQDKVSTPASTPAANGSTRKFQSSKLLKVPPPKSFLTQSARTVEGVRNNNTLHSLTSLSLQAPKDVHNVTVIASAFTQTKVNDSSGLAVSSVTNIRTSDLYHAKPAVGTSPIKAKRRSQSAASKEHLREMKTRGGHAVREASVLRVSALASTVAKWLPFWKPNASAQQPVHSRTLVPPVKIVSPVDEYSETVDESSYKAHWLPFGDNLESWIYEEDASDRR